MEEFQPSNLWDLQNALRKLKHYFYFEKVDLITRSKVLQYHENELHKLDKLLISGSSLEDLLSKVKINLYPKKVESLPNNNDKEKEKNLYSNENLDKGSIVKEFLLMADIPVEFHIISVMWLMKYGNLIDSASSDHAFGNRMEDLTETNLPTSRKIFKNYLKQYKNWWGEAIKTCKEQLDNNQSVTMINFDIKSFYNNVNLDFKEIEIYVNSINNFNSDITKDQIHVILKKLHEVYSERYFDLIGKKSINHKSTILPIGLLTSFIFANWYLKEIDNDILDLNPIFYGRYVDDFILIFIESKESKYTSVQQVLKLKLKTILKKEIQDGLFRFKKRNNLSLQSQKSFVYNFSSKFPPNLLDKFIEDQKLRSSEFRFLSDELDESFETFEKVTFEQNFDFDDGNKARFKILEENKFKMSAYFVKLIIKKIANENKYKIKEIDKIFKFFKGYFLLKHYQFWEKIFTVFVVYSEYELLDKFIKEINIEIDNCSLDDEICKNTELFRNCMKIYLNNAMYQVRVLKPKSEVKLNFIDYDEMYLLSLRSHYTFYPWLQFTNYAKSGSLDLLDREVYSKHHWENNALEIPNNVIPYRIKFYYAYMQELFKKLYAKK